MFFLSVTIESREEISLSCIVFLWLKTENSSSFPSMSSSFLLTEAVVSLSCSLVRKQPFYVRPSFLRCSFGTILSAIPREIRYIRLTNCDSCVLVLFAMYFVDNKILRVTWPIIECASCCHETSWETGKKWVSCRTKKRTAKTCLRKQKLEIHSPEKKNKDHTSLQLTCSFSVWDFCLCVLGRLLNTVSCSLARKQSLML
jgi:hypothetical protein